MKLNYDKLNICMADNCMTIDELSQKAGVSKNTLYALKNRCKNPRSVTIGKIAKALGVKTAEIID
jgi:DNA-binding Xre family transcriptional regulator